MKCLKRNKRRFWYCLYDSEVEQTDADGNYTGETAVGYNNPVACWANISPATGQSNQEMFGNLTDYDRVIVSDDLSLPIDENSVLFIDSTPTTGAGEYGYDYIVRRVAKSLNSVAIAVRKVEVTGQLPTPTPIPTQSEPDEPTDDEPEDIDGTGGD